MTATHYYFNASFCSGMEARYNCCKSIHTAFIMSSKLSSDPALAGIAAKVSSIIPNPFHSFCFKNSGKGFLDPKLHLGI